MEQKPSPENPSIQCMYWIGAFRRHIFQVLKETLDLTEASESKLNECAGPQCVRSSELKVELIDVLPDASEPVAADRYSPCCASAYAAPYVKDVLARGS